MARKRKQPASTYTGYRRICDAVGMPYGTPIIDATEDLELTVTKADVRKAKPKDPRNCGYAQALCRTLGVTNVAVTRHSTLVVGKKDRKDTIFRYRTTDDMRLLLSRFDLNGRMPEHTIVVKAPTGSYRRDARNEHDAEYRQRVKDGTHTPQPKEHFNTDPLEQLRPILSAMPR